MGMERAERAALYIFFIGIGAAMLATAGPLAFPEAPRLVWQVIFWAGCIVAGVPMAFLIYEYFIKSNPLQENHMVPTPADIGYNSALVAAIVTFVAALRRSPRIAVIACFVAWIGIGVDYWLGPPRVFLFVHQPTFKEMMEAGLQGKPIGWASAMPMTDFAPVAPGQLSNIGSIFLMGRNIGDREIKLEDLYLISGITGERLDVHAFINLKTYAIKDLNPIPPDAPLTFSTGVFKPPLTAAQFMEKWRTIIAVTKYDGQEHRATFDNEDQRIPKGLPPGPHVTPHNP
jgi:hypothetical protein